LDIFSNISVAMTNLKKTETTKIFVDASA